MRFRPNVELFLHFQSTRQSQEAVKTIIFQHGIKSTTLHYIISNFITMKKSILPCIKVQNGLVPQTSSCTLEVLFLQVKPQKPLGFQLELADTLGSRGGEVFRRPFEITNCWKAGGQKLRSLGFRNCDIFYRYIT